MRKIIIGAALGALLLLPSAVSAVTYATVDGYLPGTPENNNPATFETNGLECEKDDSIDGSTYTVQHFNDLVIVKAGSEQSAPGHVNTVFEDVAAGETVFADSNGSGTFDEGDKGISHIIFCKLPPEPTPTPTLAPTPTPTLAPTPTPTLAPTPTPTPGDPTPTPGPTATPTDTPTVPQTDTASDTQNPGRSPVLLVIGGLFILVLLVALRRVVMRLG